jgi:serine/threonine protein phosphatase 1
MGAMLSRFRSRPKRTDRLPEGLRLYAIGDIHGRRDLLDALLGQIDADLAGWGGDSEIVFLGDYVDRGNASAAVLDRLAEGPPQGRRWTLLKGNHESILAHLVSGRPREDEALYPAWLKHGGRETLASYGLPAALAFGDDEHAALGALREVMPRTHVELLESFELMRRAGDYLFVHAGIRPGVPVEEQRQRDLIWIREAFLEHKGDHGFHVVHGHSITRDVDTQANRTGIDTGAYATGRLTAMVLEGDTRRFLST